MRHAPFRDERKLAYLNVEVAKTPLRRPPDFPNKGRADPFWYAACCR